jgi:hypothetical protein
MRGGPQLPTLILKKGKHLIAAVDRDFAILPSVQAIGRSQPHGAIGRRENRRNASARQTLLDGNRRDGELAKAVEAIDRRDPDVALTILEQR